MRAHYGLVVCVLTLACAKQRIPAVMPETCPTIPPAGAPYPTVSYHTMVLDGKVLYARHRQRHVSAHMAVPDDSVAAGHKLDTSHIKEIRFLTGDSARFYEPCPGVRVVAVESERRRWWWPW